MEKMNANAQVIRNNVNVITIGFASAADFEMVLVNLQKKRENITKLID